jgi:predicted MPP superfamily phosphohydrolase
MWLWILFFEIASFRSFYDTPRNIWMHMNMVGMIVAVILPRIILIALHYSGVYIRRNEGIHIRWLTTTGIIVSILIFSIIALSTLYGRFNVKTEKVTVNIKGLNRELEGLKIVQISDLHLSGFYHHKGVIQEVISRVNDLKPDIIINTGDFITFGWREFGRFDTLLSASFSRCGNFAVIGNHDFGTYHPDYTEADLDNNFLKMNNLIKSSGYHVLNDEFKMVNVGNAKLAMIGVITKGRFPDIIHGDIDKAISGLDSADLKILLTHDPNHWDKSITGKTDIDLTFSGHTHGMQMGIFTKWFKWSPAKYFYSHWYGLYSEGDQQLYVNRGLGVLAIPFRIWMPPEITLITLKAE